ATSIAWVYEQLLHVYKDDKDNDKVITTAEALLAVDPADLDAAYDALQAAQAKGDSEAVRKYVPLSWDIATNTLKLRKPAAADDVAFVVTVANYNIQREQELPKVLSYSLRLLELLPRKPKPDDVSAEEWAAKKGKYTGWANWMAGVIYAKQARYGLTDRYLRE